jgi:hypothetical protein
MKHDTLKCAAASLVPLQRFPNVAVEPPANSKKKVKDEKIPGVIDPATIL